MHPFFCFFENCSPSEMIPSGHCIMIFCLLKELTLYGEDERGVAVGVLGVDVDPWQGHQLTSFALST